MDTIKILKRKRSAWHKYTRNKTAVNYEEYRVLRNQVTSVQRRAIREYERKVATEFKENRKSFWKYIHSKTKATDGMSALEREDGSMTENDEGKTEE